MKKQWWVLLIALPWLSGCETLIDASAEVHQMCRVVKKKVFPGLGPFTTGTKQTVEIPFPAKLMKEPADAHGPIRTNVFLRSIKLMPKNEDKLHEFDFISELQLDFAMLGKDAESDTYTDRLRVIDFIRSESTPQSEDGSLTMYSSQDASPELDLTRYFLEKQIAVIATVTGVLPQDSVHLNVEFCFDVFAEAGGVP